MRWDDGSIQPRECTSTRFGSRSPMWSHGASGFMWPMRIRDGCPACVRIRKADRQTPPSGISARLKAAVSRDLLKRLQRRSVVIGSRTVHRPDAASGLRTDVTLVGVRGSRRVVRLVVRLGRQSLPRADRADDFRQKVPRHGLEAAVLRRPQGASLRRRSDRGGEAEHLRDRRLRVDDRDLPFLADVLDHPAPALDVADRGAHVVLRDVDEDLLDRLEQDASGLDHRAVDRGSGGGDDLRGPAVDGVLVELRVDEAHLQRHALLRGERAAVHRLREGLLDQLHRLVEILDPFGRIEQHVRVLDPDDVLRVVPVHPELLELLREDLRILDALAGRDLAGADCGDDLRLERLDLHVEAVVLVRRLAFERPALAADALPVDDDRGARRDGDLVVVLDAVDRDLEVEFAHAGDQVLAGLLVDLHLDARVRLREQAQGLDELRQVRRRLRLDGDRDDRVGVVDDLLEGLHLLVVAHGRSGDCVSEPDHRDDVPRVDLVDRDAVRADDHRDGLRALGLRHPADPELLAPANLARIEATGGDFARLGIDDNFRHHEPDRTVFIDRHHRFADGRLRVSFPDDRDPDFLCFERIREVADDHVQHDVVERRLLRELFHRPLLTVLVDVLEPDARPLREGCAHGPLVVRAPERDAARLDVHHPFLSEVLGQPFPDAIVDLRDDLLESLLHLLRADLQLVDEAVDLVDEQDGPHAFLQRLTDDRLRLRHDPFDGVVEYDHAIDGPHRTGYVPAEVDVAGRVDEVDEVLAALEIVDHRRDGRVDRDAALLLLRVVVHEELLAREFLGDHPRARDEGVGEGGVVDEEAFRYEVLRARHREVVYPLCSSMPNMAHLNERHIFIHEVFDRCDVRTRHQ